MTTAFERTRALVETKQFLTGWQTPPVRPGTRLSCGELPRGYFGATRRCSTSRQRTKRCLTCMARLPRFKGSTGARRLVSSGWTRLVKKTDGH